MSAGAHAQDKPNALSGKRLYHSDPASIENIGDEALVETIREGKGAFMPSWKESLVESEIVDVAAHVRTLGR